jgi:hypothetical protein
MVRRGWRPMPAAAGPVIRSTIHAAAINAIINRAEV